MGHYCHLCGQTRANEKFSGRGHRDHVCRDCAQHPAAWRDRLECLEELHHFLEQSHISARNCDRLKILCQHHDPEIRPLAELISDIARVHPYKHRRVPNLARRHPPLFARMVTLLGDDWWDGFWSDRLDLNDEWLYARWEAARSSNREDENPF